MKKTKTKRLVDLAAEVVELEKKVPPTPYNVHVALGAKLNLGFNGDVCIGSGDCDFVSVKEARSAVEWLVDQLGGKVEWSD